MWEYAFFNNIDKKEWLKTADGGIMEALNKTLTGKKERPIKVVQFGEGNFLRAFVD